MAAKYGTGDRARRGSIPAGRAGQYGQDSRAGGQISEMGVPKREGGIRDNEGERFQSLVLLTATFIPSPVFILLHMDCI